jgi:hypothetical protein
MRQEARKQDSGVGLAAAEECKRWAGEDFKSDYSETAIVIIDCNSTWRITNKSGIESRIRKLFDVLTGNTSQYFPL